MEPAVLVLVQTVKAQHVGDSLGLCDRSARGEDGDNSASYFDIGCSTKRFQSQLRKVRAEANFPLPVRHHRSLILFLGFRREMGLSYPTDAKTEIIGAVELLEEVEQHGGFVGNVALMVWGLRDGKENVVFHVHSPCLPLRPRS